MQKNSKIVILGAKGQLGSAINRILIEQEYTEILTPNTSELDLRDEESVNKYFVKNNPKYVFFCAAYIGGIEFKKQHPAEIFINNMKMILNVFEAARKNNVSRMIYVATALVYPNDVAIPTSEKMIREIVPCGPDSPYTLVKFSGLKLCEYYQQQYGCDFFTVIPCNFFGPNAPFEGTKAGVIPSLIRKMYEAKNANLEQVEVWGTGNVGRDFLGVDDVADACIYAINNYKDNKPLNIGSGKEITIKTAAEIIKEVVGYQGELFFDKDKPEGRKHMLLDTKILGDIGWKPKRTFEESVKIAFEWYRSL